MGKLEQYANQLKAKKAKARAFIEKYERLGFTFSDALKASANEPTPNRMQKRTLDRLSKNANLDLRRLMGHVTKQRPRQKVNVTLHNPVTNNGVTNGQFTLNVTPKTIADINSNLQKLKSYEPTQKIFNAMWRDFYDRFGALPAVGKRIETEDYVLTEGWDASNIAQHLQFKKTANFNQGYIQDILNVPQTTNKGKELYKEDWHHRSFVQGVDNILNRQGGSLLSGLTRSKIDTLEYIMNTSEAWNIAKKGFSYKDGKNKGVVQDRWIKLYKAVSDIEDNDDDAFNNVKTMIDNEEDFDKILTYVNDTIKKMQDAKKDNKEEE